MTFLTQNLSKYQNIALLITIAHFSIELRLLTRYYQTISHNPPRVFAKVLTLSIVLLKPYKHNPLNVISNFAGTSLSDLNPTVMENPECERGMSQGRMRIWNTRLNIRAGMAGLLRPTVHRNLLF